MSPQDAVRTRLAVFVVCLSVLGMSVASIVAIVAATDDATTAEMARLVFAAVLPLFGTWVGTVLAFYFARENFQTAAEATRRLSGAPDPTTPVADVMIPVDKMDYQKVAPGTLPESLKLSDLRDKLDQAGRQRLPVLDSDGQMLYVLHRSTLLDFAQSKAVNLAALKDETLDDLLTIQRLKELVTAFGFVGLDARIDEARTVMRAINNCNDVFVTEQAMKDSSVRGWLTNTALAGLD